MRMKKPPHPRRIVAVVMYILSALFFSISPVVTWADWQYTRWGMTQSEVIKASGGVAQPTAQEERKRHKLSGLNIEPLLKAKWTSGQFRFVAFFYFGQNANSLSVINLNLENHELAPELVRALRSRYGEPQSKTKSSIAQTMVWRTATDNVAYAEIGRDSVTIQYSPRQSEDTKGL